MRGSLLTSLVLVSGALLFSTAVHATPIHIGLVDAGGHQQWTIGPFGDPSYLGLSGWKWDGRLQKWVPADMTNADDGDNNPGLGVCSVPVNTTDNSCPSTSETNEIDSAPSSQLIEMDISLLASDWTQVTVTLLSVEDLSTVQLYAASCSLVTAYAGNCQPATIGLSTTINECSHTGGSEIYACVYTEQYLDGLFQGSGAKAIWIQPQGPCLGSCANANFLVGAGMEHGFIMDGTPVPEPSALWMFGFGALLLGCFVELRRRRTVH